MKHYGPLIHPGDDHPVPERPDETAAPEPGRVDPDLEPDSGDWKWEPVF